jgi:hypothetical protein
MIEQLKAPNVRQAYVHFRLLGHEEGVYEDLEKVDGDFVANWFQPDDDKGRKLHKVDDYFELFSSGDQAYREADLLFKGSDPESYRWSFPPRANGNGEDFKPLLELLQLLDARNTPDAVFDERIDELVDVDEWLKVLAARTLVDDWDTLGRKRGKNAFLYLPDAGQRWRLLPWDCDLAWQDPGSPLFSDRFEGIRRILKRPAYRRRFLGYLAYLAERKMDPAVLGAALKDLQAYSGAATEPFRAFAEMRRPFVLEQIPRVPFKLTETRRIERSGEPDLLVASGTAPVVVLRFRLGGREGKARFLDQARWAAEFLVGPEGGGALLQALDFGGNEVARAPVEVAGRPSALPLPAGEEETMTETAREGKIAEAPFGEITSSETPGAETDAPPDRKTFHPQKKKLPPKSMPPLPAARQAAEAVAAVKSSPWRRDVLLVFLLGGAIFAILWIRKKK